MKTAVAFLVFNRPDTTARVFEEIRKAKPPKLLIVADGPREGRAGEAERCAAVREIVKCVDWHCEVLRNYSDTNLGCKRRVSSGLDWVFDNVEEAIILEDDCLPHPTFFRYCEELLWKYRDDERIAMIRGDNWPETKMPGYASYRFTIYPSIWGWATWGRVWKNYDVKMSRWLNVREEEWLSDWLVTESTRRYWVDIFNNTYSGLIDTWDFQFVYSAWLNSQLSIIPAVNLISNIGGGPDTTHTKDASSPRLNRRLEEMVLPLNHPENIVRYVNLDATGEDWLARIQLKAARKISRLLQPLGRLSSLRNRHCWRSLAARLAKIFLRKQINRFIIDRYLQQTGPKRLNLGCGGNQLEGWLNSDLYQSKKVVYIDISKKIPVPDSSFEVVYAEHVIEHITIESFEIFLSEVRRILNPGGRVRLATPDLDFYVRMVKGENSGDIKVFEEWYKKRKGVSNSLSVYAINSIFTEHGHRFIFNESFLRNKLRMAGFKNIKRFQVGESDSPEFRGIEGHGKVADIGEEINRIETLILEAELEA